MEEKEASIQNDGARKVDSSYKGQHQKSKVQNLTKTEATLYYHLLSISYWNSEVRENHYYYPKDKINKTVLAKSLGMGKTSIFRAFTNLKEKGIIIESDRYYYITHPRCYSYISQNMLIYLINFFPIFGPEIIKVSSILHHWKRDNGKDGFSASDLLEMIGQDRTSVEGRKKIRGILSFLKGEGIIEYYTTTEGYNGVSYIEYHITGLHLRADSLIIDFTSEEGGAIKEKILKAKKYLEEEFEEDE